MADDTGGLLVSSLRDLRCSVVSSTLSVSDLKIVVHDGYVYLKCNYECPEQKGFFESRVDIGNLEGGLRFRFNELITLCEETLRELIAEKLTQK